MSNLHGDNLTNDRVTVMYTGTRAPSFEDPRLRIHHLPMLEAVPVDFDHKKLQILIGRACTLVFYSPNSARIVAEAGALDDIDLGDHSVWAVGDKTAQTLREQLDVEAHVPDDQRFEGLLDAFSARRPPRPIVAFCLAGSPRSLAARLGGDDVYDIPVYQTCARLYPRLADELEQAATDWVAFTSPRGVRTFTSQADGADLSTVEFGAIGPTTAAALREQGLEPALVLDTPDKDLMMRRIIDRAPPDAD